MRQAGFFVALLVTIVVFVIGVFGESGTDVEPWWANVVLVCKGLIAVTAATTAAVVLWNFAGVLATHLP